MLSFFIPFFQKLILLAYLEHSKELLFPQILRNVLFGTIIAFLIFIAIKY